MCGSDFPSPVCRLPHRFTLNGICMDFGSHSEFNTKHEQSSIRNWSVTETKVPRVFSEHKYINKQYPQSTLVNWTLFFFFFVGRMCEKSH